MIIKRDSWHCKMVTYLLDSPKRDLCGYIRQVLWLLMVFIALAVCLLLWFGSTGVSIFTALGISSAGFMLLPATLTGLMAIVLILGLLGSPIYCIWYLYEKRRSRKEAEEYEARAMVRMLNLSQASLSQRINHSKTKHAILSSSNEKRSNLCSKRPRGRF